MAKKVKRKVTTTGAVQPNHVETAEVVETSASSLPVRGFTRRVPASQEFNPDYSYVVKDLKRIGVLAGTFFALLIALSFLMPLLVK